MNNQILSMDFVEAVQKGKVTFHAKPEASFAETRVKVENNTSEQIAIDFSRSGLIPTEGESQRIGLSHPKGFDPGAYILAIKPKQSSEIIFYSRCLDHHRPAPDTSTVYALIPQLLPDYIVDVLRKALNQQQVWEAIESRGGTWGNDKRSVPKINHQVLLGEWECTSPGNRYRILISWNKQENRYEGHLTQNGEGSAEVGFAVNEFCYIAYVTNDPQILSEQQKWKWGSGGVSTRQEWVNGRVDLRSWTSWNIGVFASNQKMIRIR